MNINKKKLFVKDIKSGQVNEVNLREELFTEKKKFRKRITEGTKKEKNPRYWSNKYWNKNSVTEILNEIIEPNSVDVSDLHMKDELCPKIWDGEVIDEEVRKVLLKNVIEFIKYSKVDNQTFKDITVTGSLANYNYTDTSDIDIHILIDFDQISDDKEFVGEYFKNKKNLWSENYPSAIKGHDVELYFQDTSEPHTSTGVYSLMNNEWLTKPIKKMIAIDTANVQLKAAHIMNSIDDLEDSMNGVDIVNKVDSLMERIKKMRQSGLEKEGEFATENIVFKVLRNSNYIKKLVDLKKDAMSRELTLEGTGELNEANILDFIRKHKNTGTVVLGMIVGAMASGISGDSIRQTGVGEKIIKQAEQFMSKGGDAVGDFVNFSDAKADSKIKNNEIQN